MKKLKTHTSIILINPISFTLIFILFNQSFSLDYNYELCVSKDCGNGQNISYPFYIKGLQDNSCGSPGFELLCNVNGSATIQISEKNYTIKSIRYEDNTFRVEDTKFSLPCTSTLIRNVTLDSSRFFINHGSKKLVLLSNCSSDISSSFDKYKIKSCDDEYIMLYNDVNFENVSRNCGEIVETPVDGDQTVVDGGNYVEVVERGFVMRWLAADCGDCERSGGRCGFDMSDFQFRCFCKDRPRKVSCEPGNTKRTIEFIVVLVLVVLVVIVMVIGFFIFRRRQKLKRHAGPLVPEFQMGFGDNSPEGSKHERENDDTGQMNSFNLSTILVATNNFSLDNKLGEGGFGPVYKGKLEDGKEIAVKRLSNNSGQGLVEFKTEVRLIIKLQHKNLVRLLGYCVEGPERLLIYEFMVNNSLDTLIFDPNKSKELDWPKRANIVIGIAKGLRYLHEDSRLKIIHRDMKAGNILLDNEMDSKISDFGTARIFGAKQMEASTIRIVGTYGYMAPEYAMEGLFSTKSDVYSFGVLLLEIISGQRNTRFIYNDQPQNFLTTAWRLWKENKGEELIDRFLIQESRNNNDALRWINIALLCVQEDPQDRPTMSTVVFMLEGQWSANLPTPSEPPASFARFTASDQTTTKATRDASEPRSINLASSTTSTC